MVIPVPERKQIALRTYGNKPIETEKPIHRSRRARPEPSEWALVWDTETFDDEAQQIRIGTYRGYCNGVLDEAGFFYDPLSLTDDERSLLFHYAVEHGLQVHTVAEFIEDVFFPIVYELHGLCITFNGLFDIARIALDHGPAQRPLSMRGGFSFRLSNDDRWPHIQIKHLNNRSALVQFTNPKPQKTPRGERKRGMKVPAFRGFFVDVHSLAGALLSGSWPLKELSDHLKVTDPKLDEPDFNAAIDEKFLEYALRDPLTTWECFEVLRDRYDSYGLTLTPISRIISEASLGKACLREMGIRPWRELQPDFPPWLIGIIMSTYYGGRSEVKLRRIIRRILYCDFLSMYPTICTLTRLWHFVIAKGVDWRDATAEVQKWMKDLRFGDLQRREAWPNLSVLVQVLPDGNLFPVRAQYGDEAQRTIGLNHVTSKHPIWFTLADCIASWVIDHRWPKVLRAIRFDPVGVQEGLIAWNIFGSPDYRVDPVVDDFYERMIDLRTDVKASKLQAVQSGDKELAERLDIEQNGMKITANATSYGIFVELNVVQPAKPVEVDYFDAAGEPHRESLNQYEEPGNFFHPLLATLITGGARLMLALAERLATDEGIEWAFCDTDSMALARPDGMADAEFLERAQRVRDWFTPLNPYTRKGPVFKIEDANYRLKNREITADLEPLYCFCVSPKRYALFNIDGRGRPVLRKASGHGLGHLRAPYE
jgi:hypothetical protein